MTKKQSPFVQSGFERRENDHYPTIDKRCIYALLEHFQPKKDLSLPYSNFYAPIIDPCAPNGSGIIDELREGFSLPCYGIGNMDFDGSYLSGNEWIVSNPPYTLGLVESIIKRQIDRLKAGEVSHVFMLLRSQFDHAKTRRDIFRDNIFYHGQIKMTFRPRWIEPVPGEKVVGPIHNYVWQIWRAEASAYPRVYYSDGLKPDLSNPVF